MKRAQAAYVPTLAKITLAVVILISTAQSAGASATNSIAVFSCRKNFDDEKKPARKEKSFKNQDAVRVFQDAIKRKVHVIARTGNKKEIEFLVFDINGNMVLNYKMKAGERKAISDLKKGSYMYHVFADDEYLMTGKIVFR